MSRQRPLKGNFPGRRCHARICDYTIDTDGVFGPNTLDAMTRAYQEACRELSQTEHGRAAEDVKQALAERSLRKAASGERDPVRLRLYGLLGLKC